MSIHIEDFSYVAPQKCPECGGELSEAVYYLGTSLGTTVTHRKEGVNKTVTTTTTTYSNIHSKVGGICPECYVKKNKKHAILSLVVGIFSLMVAFGGLAMLLCRILIPSFGEKAPAAGLFGFILLAAAGFIGVWFVASAIYHFVYFKKIIARKQSDGVDSFLSDAIAEELGKTIGSETVITIDKYKSMQKNK